MRRSKVIRLIDESFLSCVPQDDHETYTELRRDEEGYIVQFGCMSCSLVQGFMHPKAALDVAGPDSILGKQILSVFPEWGLPVV
jgi:hypothetical protein